MVERKELMLELKLVVSKLSVQTFYSQSILDNSRM